MSREERSCEFFACTGVCKHGDRCQKRHAVVAQSNSIVFANVMPYVQNLSGEMETQFLSHVLEDLFLYADQFGLIADFALAVNKNHLYGSFYVQFESMQAATQCKRETDGIYYAGRQIKAAFVEQNALKRGICKSFQRRADCSDDCNFIHYHRPGEIGSQLMQYNARWKR